MEVCVRGDRDLQILYVLALLNLMKLFAFPAIQRTEQKNANQPRYSGSQIAQNPNSLQHCYMLSDMQA